MHASIIEAIDVEISRLAEVRNLIAGTSDVQGTAKKVGRGRPKGSKNLIAFKALKHVMSDEGRARISAAMKKRHALKKKAAKKAAAELTPAA